MPLKTKVCLAIIILTSALGNVLISKAVKGLGDLSRPSMAETIGAVRDVLINPWFITGAALLAVFLFTFVATLSWADLSYVLPATAPSYLLVAVLSERVLGEEISFRRWLGTVLIVAGVALIVSRTDARTTPEVRAG